jgi:hypothetical protein
MKKRNKKYNKHKLSQFYRTELAKSYELWASFDDVQLTDEVVKLKNQGASKQELLNKMYELHDGDLLVVILNDLAVDNIAFFVGMDSYYYNPNDPSDIKDSAMQFDVPAMTYDQFKLGGCDTKIIDGGIKRRWKGLEAETDDVHQPFLDKGYKLLRCMCYLKADVKFKDLNSYSKFKAERVVRGARRKLFMCGV